jgi:hypothetical protein
MLFRISMMRNDRKWHGTSLFLPCSPCFIPKNTFVLFLKHPSPPFLCNMVYNQKGYIICHTTYNQYLPLLYDMVGDVKHFDEFIRCAELIRKERRIRTIKFPVVLAYMKREIPHFPYKAIRVWPHPETFEKTAVKFPDARMVLGRACKIQICFFDKTLLTENYEIVCMKTFMANQTI